MLKNKKPEQKMAKSWQRLGDIEKIIVMYFAYANPPVPIDNIIPLSGLPPVTALNLMENLKDCRFVCEKKGVGKGFYYPGDIDLQDYTLKNVPQKERFSIIEKVISFITEFHKDNEGKIIALAELYFQTGNDVDGIWYIKKAADILIRSDKREKAISYYDFIMEHFPEKAITKAQPASITEDFLDSVFQRVSRVLFYPIPLNKQLVLLEKAYEIAKRYKDPLYLAKIKFLLGITVENYGQVRRSLRYINEFWKLVANITDKNFLKEAFFLTSITKTMQGRFSEATVYYEKMIGNREEFGEHEQELLSSLLIAFSHASCGRISRGIGMIDAVRKKAQSSNLDQAVYNADFMDAITLIGIRKIPDAETCLERLLRLKEGVLNNNMVGLLHICKAFILCTKEDYAGAFKHIKKGFMYLESMDMGLHPYCPWIFECLYLLESKGFFDESVNLNIEIGKALKRENPFIKGAAYRYQALRNMDKQQSHGTILPDLRLSEKLLKQSGAEIELARTRIVMKNYYLALGKQKLARSCIEKTQTFLFKINEDVIPNDLLEDMPLERKTELIIDQIISINRSLGTLKDRPSLLDKVMNVAMDFTNATQSSFYIYEEENLKLIASRNIASPSEDLGKQKFIRESIIDTIKNNKEIILPGWDNTIAHKFSKLGIRSFIGIPVRINESGCGYLVIGNHFGGGPFPDQALPIMRMLGSQIEVGLSNISAYEGIRKLKEHFEDETIFYRREMGLDLPIEQIIGQSNGIKKVIAQIRQVAPTDSLALILGETGVGKELVAKAIHNLSNRKDGPFIPVNLTTFPRDLVISELYGHERGAFTGATEKKKGRFELADGGTIFLDEIGDLDPEVQVKLLRVFEEGTFERLGSSTPIHSDFRVIAATNKNLRQEVEKGRFRQDLYYRLSGFPIYVPPLRERENDIGILTQHFFSMFKKKLNRNIGKIPREELDKLMSYHWPGNVRELKHFIERAVIQSNGNDISLSGLEFEMSNQSSNEISIFETLADVEREKIKKTLERTLWKISGTNGAASFLGLHPSTLCHRMKKLGIEKPSITKNQVID